MSKLFSTGCYISHPKWMPGLKTYRMPSIDKSLVSRGKAVQAYAECPFQTNGARTNHASPEELFSASTRHRRRALLHWPDGGPNRVLLVKKRGDRCAADVLRSISVRLQSMGMDVLVEPMVQELEFPHLKAWTRDQDIPDFCISLGGDGTVLHAASLFLEDSPLPPLLAVAMGTLGFLTPFEVSSLDTMLERVLAANKHAMFCTLRTRLVCQVYSGEKHLVTRHAFNEASLDRGLGLNFLRMECFIDGRYVTTMMGDGLIVATPSGSTAYSMSAGGPMVAPSVPCIIMTPIAPHSLSFRPVVISEQSDVVIHLPADLETSGARVSFDGKHTQILHARDSVRMHIARFPLPMITAEVMDQDWYASITEKLMWNMIIKREKGKEGKHPLPLPAAFATAGSPSVDASIDVPRHVFWPGAGDVLEAGRMGQSVDGLQSDIPIYSPRKAHET